MAIRERVKTTDEMVDMSRYFFEAPSKYDEVGVRRFFANSGVAILLRKGAQVLDAVDDWNLDSLERAYRDLIEREGIKSGEIIHPRDWP